MWARWLIVAPAMVAVAIGSSWYSQPKIDALKDERLEEELLYLPNEKLLTHFTAGLSSVIADVLWVRTIQYTAKEFRNIDRKFTWLEHMCNTVTRLDPYFKDAYVYGGMFLAAIGADDKALRFLKRGIIDNPDSWEIPFECAKVFLLNRYKDPGSPALASYYLRMVAERSEHSDFYFNWIAGIQRQHDLGDEALRIWEDVIEQNKSPFLVELAKSKLLEFKIRKRVEEFQAAADRFASARGRAARSLAELADEGYVASVPTEPEQGEYFLDEAGAVQNSILVERVRQMRLRYISEGVARFRQERGRFPSSLEEWAEFAGTEVPLHPVAGRTWSYNPRTGAVH